MAYSLLNYSTQAKQNNYQHHLRRRSESRYKSPRSEEWKSVDLKHALDILSGVLYKKLFFTFHDVFKKLKSILDESRILERSFENRLFEKLNNVFNIAENLNIGAMAEFFSRLKEINMMSRVLERTYFIIQDIAIRNLATHSRIKKFRKVLLQSSKRNRLRYDEFKIRMFMGKCEAVLSRKAVSKQKHKAFKEWHLQSVLHNLQVLCEDQKSLVFEQKKIAIALLLKFTLGYLQQAWIPLKNYNNSSEYERRFFYFRLRVRTFIEKLNILFIRGCLNLFPLANINSHLGIYKLYCLALGFDTLKRYNRPMDQLNRRYTKATGIIANIVRDRIMREYHSSFIILKSYVITVSDLTKNMNENKIKATEKLVYLLTFLSRKYIYEFFQKVKSIRFETQKSIKENHISEAVLLLSLVLTKKKAGKLTSYFYKWKSNTKFLTKESKDDYKPLVTKRIIQGIQNLYLSRLRDTWDQLLTFSKKQKKSKPKAIAQDLLLINTVANQAAVNARLEQKHQKRHQLWVEYKQKAKLYDVLAKDAWRQEHNKNVLRKSLRTWQNNISFENNKIQEYAQCLTILETEIHENKTYYMTSGALQLENMTIEPDQIIHGEIGSPMNPRGRDLSRQIRYLEFLEIQNSNLMEILASNEREFEEGDVGEIEEMMSIKHRNRCYTI